MQTLQFDKINWLRNLPQLTDTENAIVHKALSDPAVIKYFNLLALNAITDFRLVPAVEAAHDVQALIARESFTKGVISVVDGLLTFLEK